MSDAHSKHDEDGPHEGPIKTPKQLVLAVVFSFLVPIIGIVLLVTFVSQANRPAAGSDGLAAEAVARRIQPVGQVVVRDASDPSALKTGEQVYTAQCAACHAAGVAGAPKFGDEGAWAARIKTGYEALLTSALKGKGAMGPQGGGDHSDLEIGRAVVFMANKAGAGFPEPKAPAAAAPKLGDKAAWAPRLAAGIDGLTASAIKGKGAMPPRGGSAGTDADIKAVVTYMVGQAK
ncbi:c-type cytochrome [Piscinibacter sakaiensis]|uniref:c-type cytochrome n=1 Tax=Piscinibacter sakaiensis TaxID=1547922 RepID=UPI00372C9988